MSSTRDKSMSRDSMPSVASHNLFREGHDNIVMEGYLYKLKPGLSSNFVKRYVQISKRAFRYFKDKPSVAGGKPLVAIRKHIVKQCVEYKVNKKSYIKKGARVNQNRMEHELFDNMFEMQLNEDYEDNLDYRDLERNKMAEERKSSLKSSFVSRGTTGSLSQKKLSVGLSSRDRIISIESRRSRSSGNIFKIDLEKTFKPLSKVGFGFSTSVKKFET